MRLVVFNIEGQRYALDLSSVDRTLRATKITPLPNAPGIVLGVIESFAGQAFGPQHALTVGFLLMLVLLVVKPTGLVGIKGYE